MANIKQQRKRVRTQERERNENLRYRSTIKTLSKRLETAVADGDADRIAAEHRELVRTIDRARRVERCIGTPPGARSRGPRDSSPALPPSSRDRSPARRRDAA